MARKGKDTDKELKSKGIKPIIGCEVYVAPESRFNKSSSQLNKSYHLVLLCENEIGYKNLIYMVSKGFTEGFYSKPRIDIALLREHSKGLIALSGCVAGQIPKQLARGDRTGAIRTAHELSSIFGKDRFYIELQNHGLEEELPFLQVDVLIPRFARAALQSNVSHSLIFLFA